MACSLSPATDMLTLRSRRVESTFIQSEVSYEDYINVLGGTGQRAARMVFSIRIFH